MKKYKILFLDDAQFEMLGFVEYLEYEGYEVVNCFETKQAIEKLKSGFTPDLIISDLIMRNNEEESTFTTHHAGVEFCIYLRNEIKIKCPIIVLSVVTDEEVLKRLKSIGDIHILHKPIYPRTLLTKVGGLIK